MLWKFVTSYIIVDEKHVKKWYHVFLVFIEMKELLCTMR
jgi:hypothetical protein